MAIDEFVHQYGGESALDWPATKAVAVTPSDSTDLEYIPRALYVGGEGNLKVDMMDGSTVTFASVPVGIFPIRVTRVYSTGTAATNIIAVR